MLPLLVLCHADPARLQNWGLVAFLPRRQYEGPHLRTNSVYAWVLDFIRRCGDLGMDMGYQPGDVPEVRRWQFAGTVTWSD